MYLVSRKSEVFSAGDKATTGTPEPRHAVRYANWKTSTEATVAVTARSACAKRAMRWIWFVMCILR
jgi:hypothetical protein